MSKTLYLFWCRNWEVSSKLPNPEENKPILPYAYKQYNVPEEKWNNALYKLSDIKKTLENNKIVPTRNTASTIFPSLVEILEC